MTATDQVVTILCALTALVICVLAYRSLRVRSAGEQVAGLVIAGGLALEYSVRPLYVAIERTYGWDPATFAAVEDLAPGTLSVASVTTLLGVVGFWLAFTLVRATTARSEPERVDIAAAARPPAHMGWAAMVVIISIVASSALALTYGRLGATLSGDYGRQEFSSGYIYAFVSLGGVAIAFAAARTTNVRRVARFTWLVIFGGLVLFASVHLLVLGGRGDIIVIGVAVAIVVLQRRRRIPLHVLLLLGLLAVSVLATYRIATREVNYATAQDASAGELVAEAASDPLGAVLRGDVSAYDKIVLLDHLDVPRRDGQTYVAAAFVALPGDAGEGGNRDFTRVAQPQRYAANRTFEGVSLMAEGWLNFGPLGAISASVVAGVVYGAIWRRLRRPGLWRVVAALLIGVFPTLLRADLFNTVAFVGAYSLLILAVQLALSPPRLIAHRTRRLSHV